MSELSLSAPGSARSLEPPGVGRNRLSIAVFLDSPDENWLAMNLAGEMLLTEWKTSLASEVEPAGFSIDLPRVARRVPTFGTSKRALQLDKLAGRFLVYPPLAVRERRRHDFFHVVDHSYAQLVHVLPRERTGVYCHDLNAFRSLLEPEKQPRSALFRAMQGVAFHGLRAARIVFYSTGTVRAEIEAAGIVPPSRLVQAPYGIAAELRPPKVVVDGTPKRTSSSRASAIGRISSTLGARFSASASTSSSRRSPAFGTATRISTSSRGARS